MSDDIKRQVQAIAQEIARREVFEHELRFTASGMAIGAVAVLGRNPHRSGIHYCHLSPQIVNVLPTTIAHTHQPGHPIKNSLRDPP